MSGTNYYWQGGRKIEIQQGENSATIQADTVTEVEAAAAASGVPIRNSEKISSGLVRLEIPQGRDQSMDKLRESHVVHHVYHTKDQPEDELIITDTFFLKFKNTTTRDQIDHYIKTESLEIADVFDDHTFLVRVTNATGKNPLKTANLAVNSPIVEYAEPNIVRRLNRFSFIPTDPLFANQWHLHAPGGGVELVAGVDIKAPEAWEETLGSRDIVIAIADDGHDITHPDFQGQDKIAGSLNIIAHPNGVDISFDSNVLPQPGDYHGTPCSGVAVAEHNGVGTLGVAPGCSFLPVRFPLTLSDAQLARMFDRISTQADIVSCSWGVGPANAPLSSVLSDKISVLAEHGGRRGQGLIFCIAAGNNNCPVKNLNNTATYHYRNRFGSISSYSGPIDRWIAAHPDVITISAISSQNRRSAYSSWGDDINVCAPSNNFHDLDLFHVPGRGIWTTDNEGFGAGSDFTTGSRYTGSFGGTSSATPTVAGVCGLVLSRNSALSGSAVRELIQTTASKNINIDTDTPVNEPGDFNAGGFSRWYGFGKVDAAAAVSRAAALAQEQTQFAYAARDVPLEIPDTGEVVSSTIDITDTGLIADLQIRVNISHTFIGDLRIDLLTPDNRSVNLHNQQGGSADDIDQIYSADSVAALSQLIGSTISGRWQLRVSDRLRFDTGRLENWEIRVKTHIVT